MTKQKSLNQQKICNICGNDCEVWSVDKNAIICKDCKPNTKKKIISETDMLNKIISGEKIK